MFNATQLLGQLMGGGSAPSAQNRMTHAMGSHGLSANTSPLSGLLGNLMGGGQTPGASGAGGFGGLASMAQQALGGVTRKVRGNNPLAVGGLGALAGVLLGGRSGALGGGAAALLGSLAYAALKPKAADAAPPSEEEIAREAPLGLREPRNAEEERELEKTSLLIIRAMSNAAKADGEVSSDEVFRILGKLQENGADDEARAFVEAELRKPMDAEAMVREVQSPEVAVEVYAASLLAIEVDTDAERQYLANLAKALNLNADVVARIHHHLGVPPIA